MQIACPTCATRYEVSTLSIGADGRAVRCARCRTVWRATPNDENVGAMRTELHGEPPPGANYVTDLSADAPAADELTADAREPVGDTLPATDIETVAAAASVADHPVDLDAGRPPIVIDKTSTPDAPAGEGSSAEVKTLAAHRRRRQGRRPPPSNTGSRRRMSAVIVALFAIIGALVGWRGEVVRRAPQMASLYSAVGLPVNLRKLVFADIRMARETHDGVPIILIQGTIVSTSPTPVEVPRLRFAVRNKAGAEIYTWTAPPTEPKLAPFESLPFQSRLAAPPDGAHDIVVRFFNRRDAVASLQ